MGVHIRRLVKEAVHLVALVVAVGIGLAGTAALVGLLFGTRGGHEVTIVVGALAVVGALGIAVAVFLDPDGFSADTYQGVGSLGNPTGPSDAETAGRIMVTDDVLYAGGVLLIGFAVLLGFVCAWLGVPPTIH